MPQKRSKNRLTSPPLSNANFLVDMGTSDPYRPENGFCEVVFPAFNVAAGQGSNDARLTSQLPLNYSAAPDNHLVLRRGVTGRLDLYSWWNDARSKKKTGGRTITVSLLASDLETVALTWRFSNARPVSLVYSPLNSMQGQVLLETIVLEFDDVRIESAL